VNIWVPFQPHRGTGFREEDGWLYEIALLWLRSMASRLSPAFVFSWGVFFFLRVFVFGIRPEDVGG
jgi:hypothetical protein